MKKLIAISVMLALVAGAVFAEVGGGMRFIWDLVEKQAVAGSDKWGTSARVDDTTVNFKGTNENETISFNFRVKNFHRIFDGNWAQTAEYNSFFSHNWVKWSIIPQLKLYAGKEDGWFGFDPIFGWGFHEQANDGASIHGYAYGAGSIGGFMGNPNHFGGIAFEILPMDGLSIALGFPINSFQEYKNVFYYPELHVSFAFDGIGKFYLGYKGDFSDNKDYGDLGIGFEGTFGPATIVFGGALDLKDNSTGNRLSFGATLAAKVEFGDFGLKARIALPGFGSGYKFNINANVMPYYNLGFMTVYASLGVHFSVKPANWDPTQTYYPVLFYINPYVRIPLGGCEFMAAVQVDGIGQGGTPSFKIPLVLQMNF